MPVSSGSPNYRTNKSRIPNFSKNNTVERRVCGGFNLAKMLGEP